MNLEFSFKYKDYEIKACPSSLVRFSPDEPNETVNLLRWVRLDDREPYCYSLAYFVRNNEGYYLRFVGDRPFTDIENEDVKIIWSALKHAQEILNEFFEEGW